MFFAAITTQENWGGTHARTSRARRENQQSSGWVSFVMPHRLFLLLCFLRWLNVSPRKVWIYRKRSTDKNVKARATARPLVHAWQSGFDVVLLHQGFTKRFTQMFTIGLCSYCTSRWIHWAAHQRCTVASFGEGNVEHTVKCWHQLPPFHRGGRITGGT